MRLSLRTCTRLTSNFLTDLTNAAPINPAGIVNRSTVFLTHVKWVTGKTQLEKYFSRYGKVQDVLLFFDAKTGLHRGFASVTFANSQSADAAIKNRPHVIDGDLVGVEFHMPLKNSKQKYQTM